MNVKKRTRVEHQIFDAEGSDLFEHRIEHEVAVPQMMMERDRHAVPKTGRQNRVPQAFRHFIIQQNRPAFRALSPLQGFV